MKRMRMTKDNNLLLKEGWEKFYRHCKIKDLAQHTLEYYQDSYDYFINFLKAEFEVDETMKVKEIDKELIEEFTLWLNETYNMKNTTINTRLRGLRTFIYYLGYQKIIKHFMRILKGEIDDKIFKEALSHYEDISNHIAIFEQESTVSEMRNRIKAIIQKQESKPVVIIDYLQIIQPDHSQESNSKIVQGASSKQVVENNISRLKRLTRELEIPVILISSFNRSNYYNHVDYCFWQVEFLANGS